MHPWMGSVGKSGPFSRGGLHVAIPFIKLCLQRRILLPGGYPRAIPILFYYPLRPEGDIKKNKVGHICLLSPQIC